MIEIVRRFRRLRALVIGEAMLDHYLEGTATRICSEGPIPVVRRTAEAREPGGAANSAANLRALGAEVVFPALVGRDPAGEWLRAALRDRGVDDGGLIEADGVATLHKLRVLADGQYVVRFDQGGYDGCSAEERRRLSAAIEAAVPACDVVVVADYASGALDDGVVAALRRARARHPRPLVVDSKFPARFATAGASVITPNLLEAYLACGLPPVARSSGRGERLDLAAVDQLACRLLNRIDCDHVAITLAADGVYLRGRDGDSAHLPAHPVAQPNDVGAGDTFTAALALALAAGAPLETAAAIGIDAAGIAVTKRRTAVVSHGELLQRVSLREHAVQESPVASVAEVAARLAVAGAAGRMIVFTNGVFDILHAGHVELLRAAKALGDVLVVGVNSDRSARRLKGKHRPINPERDRAALVAALGPVDYAVIFDEDEPSALIRTLRPHIHVKGGDYVGMALPEASAVEEVGGRIAILPLAGATSTTGVIDRIATLFAGHGPTAAPPPAARAVGERP